MATKQLKATFLLPLHDHDGTRLSAKIQLVEEACYAAFGAWTHGGYTRGAWRLQSGERQVDACAVYSVVIDEKRLHDLELILEQFKHGTKQEAIYLEVQRNIELRLL